MNGNSGEQFWSSTEKSTTLSAGCNHQYGQKLYATSDLPHFLHFCDLQQSKEFSG